MFTRAAKYMRKVISYPSNLSSAISMVAMVFIMATVVVSVIARFVFDAPIRGAWDLVTVCFAVMVWGPMAMAALKGNHTALTFVLDKFPRLPRSVMQLIISLGTSGILGIVTWRLVAYGIRIGESVGRTALLRIPYEPFVYFTAAGCALTALAFLVGIPEALANIRKEQ